MQACISCGALLKKYGEVSGFNILKCPNCGLGVTETANITDYNSYHRDDTYFNETKQFANIF